MRRADLMIRLALALLLTTLPALAQDYRGLRPGMHASALGPIGEPMAIDQHGALTYATYPLPFEQALNVIYDGSGEILWLNSFAFPYAPDAPLSRGLRVNTMTLAQVMRRLGPEAPALDTPGLISPNADGGAFRLVLDNRDDPEMLVVLTFADPDPAAILSDQPMSPPFPRDAVLIAASLAKRDFFEETLLGQAYVDGARPEPIPFPLPIDEAFPSLIP